MAVRVTSSEVLEVLGTATEYDFDLTPFITGANLLVNTYLLGKGLSADLLKEIERWMAAHLATVRAPRVEEEKIGTASTTYMLAKPGTGILTSEFGRTAASLDSTGILSNIGKGKAIIKHLGST